MNNKQREILHQHKYFLVKNIPWTDDLANKLLAQGVITDSFLKDIQVSHVIKKWWQASNYPKITGNVENMLSNRVHTLISLI